MQRQTLTRPCLFVVALVWASNTFAAPITTLCYKTESRLNKTKLQTELGTLPPELLAVYRDYEVSLQHTPILETAFPRRAVYELLRNPEGEFLMHAMHRVITAAEGDTGGVTNQERSSLSGNFADLARAEQDTVARVRRQLIRELTDKVPADQIEERVAALGNGDPVALERALGYLTVGDAGLLVHGGSPLAPTPQSLLGKYIAETGAATVVRTFGTSLVRGRSRDEEGRAINPNSRQGPQRLVIAVSVQSLPVYLKYFSIPNLMPHLHGPQQGTLYIGFMGNSGSYGRIPRDNIPIRASLGAIWPHILLSTSEGGRARAYFDIALRTPIAKQPWRLEGFCATGGYSSCTHWWGEMGIGDRRVTEWVFPGAVDAHSDAGEAGDRSPRVQSLASYRMPQNIDPVITARIRRLMTYPTAGEQLAMMLGTRSQLTAGEWANPGYVALTLLSKAHPERVPFVFYVVPNHSAPIDPAFDPQVSAY